MSITDDKLRKIYRSFPKIFKADSNPVLNALIRGFAGADTEILTQLENTKAQMFIKTAEGQYLNRLAASLGVARPTTLGLTDDDFRELIPNLSLKAKQIRKTFYDTIDVFWGPLFSRANIMAANEEPYNISPGDEFKFKIDNGALQTIKVLANDIAIPGAATIEELQNILSRVNDMSTTVSEDPATNNRYLVCRTNTPGLRGSIEVLASSGIGSTKVDLEINKVELWQQAQRSVIYEINPNEIIIEIPAIVPALRRTLKGSHHFHTDSTIEAPVAPANGIWEGSFFFDPNGTQASYTITGQNAKIQESLNAGNIYTKVTVDDTSKFENTEGFLIFGWGTEDQELPIRYRGIPNSNTVLLDPSYIFQKNHTSGSYINVLKNQIPKIPLKNGEDLAVYLTSPAGARETVQALLRLLAAAGIVVTFIVLAPEYIYMIDNPYISTDDAPSD